MKQYISDWIGLLIPEELSLPVQTDLPQADVAARVLRQVACTRVYRTTRQKALRRVVCIAALLCALVATVAASAIFGWDQRLLDFLGITPPWQEKLTDAGQQVEISVTRDGVTVEVKQVVGDENTAYVLCQVTFLEEMPQKPPYLQFADRRIEFAVTGPAVTQQVELLTDEDPEDNVYAYLFCLQSDESMRGHKMVLTLGDLGYFNPEMLKTEYMEQIGRDDFIIWKEGPWEIAWNMDYQNEKKLLAVDEVCAIGQGRALVKQLQISNLSMEVTLVSDRYPDMAPQLSEEEVYSAPITVAMRDGTVLEQYRGLEVGQYQNVRRLQYQCRFERPVEFADIEYVRVGDLEIPLGE